MAIMGLVMGMVWTVPIGIVVGGIVAEVVLAAGKRTVPSYVVAFAHRRRYRRFPLRGKMLGL